MDSVALRRINRQVAAKFIPELAVVFDGLVAQGFKPRVTSLLYEGEALAYFNQLVAEYEQSQSTRAVTESAPSA